jgi:hypothetical protein
MAARQAHPQVKPRVSRLHAILTIPLVGGSDLDLIEMIARSRHWPIDSLMRSEGTRMPRE